MQKTAYELRISDWSSDVCSSELIRRSQLLSKTATGEGRTTDGWIDGEEERVRALGVFESSSGSCLSVAAISAPTCVAVRAPASGLRDRASCFQRTRTGVRVGKSVYVHLGLGGRRLVKKKK